MFRDPSIGAYYQEQPQQAGEGWRRWITRAANFAIIYTEGTAGASLSDHFADEHFLYSLAEASASGQAQIKPPWVRRASPSCRPESAPFISARAATAVQVVTARESPVAAAANAATYAGGAKEVAPVEAWPEPLGGYKVRTYATRAGYARGGLVHAYRTRKLMIVPYERFLVPRDETQLSPHAHADFEQVSVALEGEWLHHLRVPWTINRQHWKPDRTVEIGSPSVTVHPGGRDPHSQGIAGAGMRLIDVFSPPRADFSQRGLVDNADEYPMPSTLAGA